MEIVWNVEIFKGVLCSIIKSGLPEIKEHHIGIQLSSCIGYLSKLINNNIIILCDNTKSHHLSIDPNSLALSNRVPGQLPVQSIIEAKLLRGGVGLVEVLTTRGISLKRQVIPTQLRKQLRWGTWGTLITSMQ